MVMPLKNQPPIPRWASHIGLTPRRLCPLAASLLMVSTVLTQTLTRVILRYGEDVVLTNVLAFDVQVWDPYAPVQAVGTAPNQVAVGPSDPGYTVGGTAVSQGAFVDLNWANTTWSAAGSTDPFQTQGHLKSKLTATATTQATYDTWSFHYEHDGINQLNPNSPNTADQGTNGFDDDGNGIVDDAGERETSPPYPVPLRGIKVRIRCYEPDARQVHEVTVVESFVPE